MTVSWLFQDPIRIRERWESVAEAVALTFECVLSSREDMSGLSLVYSPSQTLEFIS